MTAQPYDKAYWNKYRHYDETPCGDALTQMRRALVAKYWPYALLDVGIGGGRFVRERPRTFGYDINPEAIAWLHEHDLFVDPYGKIVPAVSCWDSLEHIGDPRPLLEGISEWLFVSLPIFTDCEDALRSKHFRPDEHFWYFTDAGFVYFMSNFGFKLVEHNEMEQSAGREQIGTFVFRRIG